ncbi:hypothetical protein M2R47_08450 [Moraxella sp. Tifton1]|uniref:hypothetical protein n=1 Tax=Moraxella oculi TaxID=2940516 RepID=UPI00201352F7|nr:hypothetical protein [Moraxella sp. Tifton1]MCL1624263.1 hypothetical protein [Moraxella sp. Tifton1]
MALLLIKVKYWRLNNLVIEIIPQSLEKFSINHIEKIYGSEIQLFDNDIEIVDLNKIYEENFYMIHSINKDIICSIYLDKFQCQHMSSFEYLSDENIFNLDIKQISYQWGLLNFLRIKINSENIIDIHKDNNFLKIVYSFALAVDGHIYVTEFIPDIKSGLHSTDDWINYLKR